MDPNGSAHQKSDSKKLHDSFLVRTICSKTSPNLPVSFKKHVSKHIKTTPDFFNTVQTEPQKPKKVAFPPHICQPLHELVACTKVGITESNESLVELLGGVSSSKYFAKISFVVLPMLKRQVWKNSAVCHA